MTENSKKNKRGARGSIEDEVNEAKRPFTNSDNMADQENSRAEPTLSDLRSMLADLQSSVNTIMKDNRNLKKEIMALKTTLDNQGREFQKMKDSVHRIIEQKRMNPSRANSYELKKTSRNRRKKCKTSGHLLMT